MGRFRGWVV